MNHERGFALVAVMILLLIAAAAAGAAQLAARADVGQSDAIGRQFRLESAIDGACALALADLADGQFASHAPRLDGSKAVSYAVGGASVKVRAVSESGRLNVNLAQAEDVAAVLRDRGGSAGSVAAVTRALDELRHEGKKLTHLVELRAFFGEDGRSFYAVAPFLTTRTDVAIDEVAAPAGLRRALPRLARASTSPSTSAPGAPTLTGTSGATLKVDALPLAKFPMLALFLDARLPGGAHLTQERVVSLSPQGDLLTLERRSDVDEALVQALLGPDQSQAER